MLFTIGFDMAENLFMSYLCDTVPLLWFQVIPWPKPCHGKNDHVGSLLPDLCGKMHVLWWKISAASQRAPRMTHDYSADHVVKPEETHVLVFIYTSNKQQAVSISVSCVFAPVMRCRMMFLFLASTHPPNAWNPALGYSLQPGHLSLLHPIA